MAMTQTEKATKMYLYNMLCEQGYPTYGKLFMQLDLHLTSAPDTVAFMNPKDGSITINRGLDESQFSVIIRHEILHGYLKHEMRMLQHLAAKNGYSPDNLTEENINDLKKILYKNQLFNIAADYEISNRAYTDEDKADARAILLNGEKLKGLVTEDDHPDWIDLSVEDMYDKLSEEMEKEKQKQQDNKNQENNKDKNSQTSDKESNEDSEPDSNTGDSDEDNPDDKDADDKDADNASDEGSESEDGESTENDSESEPSDDNKADSLTSSNNKDEESNQDPDSDESSGGEDSSDDKSDSADSDSSSNEEDEDDEGESNHKKDSNGSSSSSKGYNSNSADDFIMGTYIDEYTFLDRDGNVISLK